MQSTIDFINEKTNNFKPEIAIVLGSGLGDFTSGLEGNCLKYSEIPDFLTSTVDGHKGELFFTKMYGKKMVIMSGRFHYYEGYDLAHTTLPIKVFKKLGVKQIILTNAAGGVNKSFRPGDLVLIKDHINFMGKNPLIGPNDETLGPRFPDMSCVYDKNLRKHAQEAAKTLNIPLKQGVYLAVSGPSYETPAEIKIFEQWGADLVGMSTVPEAIVARHCSLEVLGISLCTNCAATATGATLSHEEVVKASKEAGAKFKELLKEILLRISV